MDARQAERRIEQRIDELAPYGIDYADALDRFDGNEGLFAMLVVKYREDTHLAQLETALETGDVEAGAQAAHALKGVAGNLSLGAIHQLAGDACTALRSGDTDTARQLLSPLHTAHESAVEGIRRFF